ncbi:sensor histidine kinase [Aliiroseovarius sp. PTFE2010]|uniref:sensor histidine kinase n=1 Tax=Aliiroseovarius sp. PTFE2010 TaxID=3417190 RepID=UPI003CF73B56
MKPPIFSRTFVLLGVLLVTLAAGLVVWTLAWRAAVDRAAERGEADLGLAADRLTGQLRRYRELAVLLADHPVLLDRLNGAAGPDVAAFLVRMADKTGSVALQLVDGRGQVLATGVSAPTPPDTDAPHLAVDIPQGALAALERALGGALGTAHFIDPSGARRFAFAAPIFSPQGPAYGAIVVHVDVAAIEWNWPSEASAVFFTDPQGVVFVTSRSDLILTRRGADFPGHSAARVGPHEVWRLDGGPYLPDRALHLQHDLPVVGLRAELLLNLRPAWTLAALQAAFASALALMVGAFVVFATERRRTLSRANAELEARVTARTADLRATNAELTREIGERKEAEARLKRAQADLVQAGKLTALGQMSAGISHELNQPLMAIRSFAENAEQFLDRGAPEKAADNLGRISDLARRMGRIIQNLRAFARNEKETIADVDLVGVVDAVLEMAQGTLAAAEVSVDWQRPAAPAMVRGGDVRLQQVVMNLVSNAIDAMSGSARKQLDLWIDRHGGATVLHVADTGAGISDPAKVFDPFYSTKEVGASEGMGLGLSISYGLVQSFGGAIRGGNRPDGGAEFTVALNPAQSSEAA